jgi:hypothetical protein
MHVQWRVLQAANPHCLSCGPGPAVASVPAAPARSARVRAVQLQAPAARARPAPAAAQVHEQARLDNELLPLRRQLSLALKDRDASAPPPRGWHPPCVLCSSASARAPLPGLRMSPYWASSTSTQVIVSKPSYEPRHYEPHRCTS